MNDLDVFLGRDDDEPAGSRGRAALATFALAVVTALVGVGLAALLLYGLGVAGVALWDHWWDGFA